MCRAYLSASKFLRYHYSYTFLRYLQFYLLQRPLAAETKVEKMCKNSIHTKVKECWIRASLQVVYGPVIGTDLHFSKATAPM